MKELQKKTLKDLYSMDAKLKFDSNWNHQVKELFDKYSTFNFDELVKIDVESAQNLINRFNVKQ